MRVVFMGTPDFAVPTLDALAASEHEVICVVAQPDRPKGRGKKMQSPDTVVRARELGFRFASPRPSSGDHSQNGWNSVEPISLWSWLMGAF